VQFFIYQGHSRHRRLEHLLHEGRDGFKLGLRRHANELERTHGPPTPLLVW
jgi:hypothetical protein